MTRLKDDMQEKQDPEQNQAIKTIVEDYLGGFFEILKELSKKPHEEVVCKILNQFDKKEITKILRNEHAPECSHETQALKSLKEEYPKAFAHYMSMSRGEFARDRFLAQDKDFTEEASIRTAKGFEVDSKKGFWRLAYLLVPFLKRSHEKVREKSNNELKGKVYNQFNFELERIVQFWDFHEKTSHAKLLELIGKESPVAEKKARYLEYLPRWELLPILYFKQDGELIVESIDQIGKEHVKNKGDIKSDRDQDSIVKAINESFKKRTIYKALEPEPEPIVESTNQSPKVAVETKAENEKGNEK